MSLIMNLAVVAEHYTHCFQKLNQQTKTNLLKRSPSMKSQIWKVMSWVIIFLLNLAIHTFLLILTRFVTMEKDTADLLPACKTIKDNIKLNYTTAGKMLHA